MKKVMAVLFIGLTVADAAAGERMSYGEAEYLNSCAVCHGVEGKGDGPLSDLLVKRPADLTSISKRNGGRFPYARVIAVIDGRLVETPWATPAQSLARVAGKLDALLREGEWCEACPEFPWPQIHSALTDPSRIARLEHSFSAENSRATDVR